MVLSPGGQVQILEIVEKEMKRVHEKSSQGETLRAVYIRKGFCEHVSVVVNAKEARIAKR